jgi:hypothetical protein
MAQGPIPMRRWRDLALVVALLAVGVAAIWGPRPGSGTAASPTQTLPAASPSSETTGPSPVAAGLTVAVADVVTTATPDGSSVLSVRLTARLRSDDVLMLRTDASGPAITFRLAAPRSVGVAGTLRTAAPATIPAGSVQTYDLTFDLRGLSLAPPAGVAVAAAGPWTPGVWLLAVDLVDVAGVRHHAETQVVIVPRA